MREETENAGIARVDLSNQFDGSNAAGFLRLFESGVAGLNRVVGLVLGL